MEIIYNEVAKRLNINKQEVEIIYRDYIHYVKKEMLLHSEREIYFEQFGKLIPSIFKLKKKLKAAFKVRNKKKVTNLIKTLKQLNYKPKQ
jgi:hypothetical protein